MFLWERIFCFGIMAGTIHSQTYDDVYNLRSTLLTSYNADILPLEDQTGSLNINLSMVVFMMPDVDAVQGAVTMGIMMTQEWYDDRLTWTPADHNGVASISMKSEDVWTPPLTVSNPVKFTNLDTSWMQVMIMANGKVSYTVGGVVQFSCDFYMKFWPFDKQICSLSLFPYGYPASKVTFSVPETVVDTSIYSPNGEWYLDESSFQYVIDSIFGMSRITYNFKIDRLPSFYVITVVMPIFAIGALTCLVFILPSESGERVGYSITVMLSLAVFLTVTAEDMPKNSEPIPIMFIYIVFNLAICIGGLVFVILNLFIYHRSENVRIKPFYISMVKLSKGWRCRNKVQEKEQGRDEMASGAKTTVKTKTIFVAEAEESNVDMDENIEWKDVSEAIDKILFYGMGFFTYIPSIIILIYTSAASDYVTQ